MPKRAATSPRARGVGVGERDRLDAVDARERRQVQIGGDPAAAREADPQRAGGDGRIVARILMPVGFSGDAARRAPPGPRRPRPVHGDRGSGPRSDRWRAPLINDTGQYLYVGETMLDGGTPYVDAANNKGPVTYLLFALIELVSGTHPVARSARRCCVFAGLAALALAGYVAHYAGRAAGVVAGVTLALLAGAPALQGSDPNTEQFGIAPMVGAWYLATRGSARTAAAAGGAARRQRSS